MKSLPFMAFLLLAFALPGPAQMQVELLLEQEQFLRDESMPVKIRLTNRSGQTLRLGEDKNWLTFTIESRDGFLVRTRDEVSVPGEFSLDSSLSMSRTVDLMPYFDLSRPGRYVVRATVKVKAWNEEFSSRPKNFDIVRGTKIWEQEFGVPAPGGGPPAMRKYALQQANYLKHLRLYVRVTDPGEETAIRVLSIGPLVSFSRPEAEVDKTSNLHVLFQTGARSFSYTVNDPEGEIILRQTYEYNQTRPTLRSGEDGKVAVKGGMRKARADDYPPTPPVSPSSDAKP